MADCKECNEPLVMRYPGNDPENGAARPICKNKHLVCNACGEIGVESEMATDGMNDYHWTCCPDDEFGGEFHDESEED